MRGARLTAAVVGCLLAAAPALADTKTVTSPRTKTLFLDVKSVRAGHAKGHRLSWVIDFYGAWRAKDLTGPYDGVCVHVFLLPDDDASDYDACVHARSGRLAGEVMKGPFDRRGPLTIRQSNRNRRLTLTLSEASIGSPGALNWVVSTQIDPGPRCKQPNGSICADHVRSRKPHDL